MLILLRVWNLREGFDSGVVLFAEKGLRMKIAITATGPSLDDQVEARFGRAPYYLFVETETMEVETVQNPNAAAGGGAGIQSAQLMSDHDVKYVLTGNCGPNAS